MIEELAEKEDFQDKIVFFYKTEPTLEPNIQHDNIKDSSLSFREPIFAYFLVGGEVAIRNARKHEVVGMLMVLEQKELWTDMLKKVIDIPDNQLSDGFSLSADEHHSWYFHNFESKEQLVGLVQSNFKVWSDRMANIKKQHVPQMVSAGDDTVRDIPLGD